MSLKESVLSGTYLAPLTTDELLSDGHMRTELEVSLFEFVFVCHFKPFMYLFQTRMVHCKPAELLLAEKGLTKPTERMLKHFSGCVPWTLPVYKGLTSVL
jgi:hypothetical protein